MKTTYKQMFNKLKLTSITMEDFTSDLSYTYPSKHGSKGQLVLISIFLFADNISVQLTEYREHFSKVVLSSA